MTRLRERATVRLTEDPVARKSPRYAAGFFSRTDAAREGFEPMHSHNVDEQEPRRGRLQPQFNYRSEGSRYLPGALALQRPKRSRGSIAF